MQKISSSPNSHLKTKLYSYLFIHVCTGMLLGTLASNIVFAFIPADWMGTLIGALLGVHVALISQTRHLLLLTNLPNVNSLKHLLKSRNISQLAHRQLIEDYQKLEFKLIHMLAAGQIENSSYQDQMDLARLLYPSHRWRFWATSLDLWSTFLKSNEIYVQQMASECSYRPDNSTSEPTNALEPTQTIPARARIFILPIRSFIHDTLHSPTEARILVLHHLKTWGVPVRLLLHNKESAWSLFKQYTESFESNPGIPRIPDFMIVDDSFVYGRRTPEILEVDPLERLNLELVYSADKKDIQQYKILFERLWENSLDMRTYCNEIYRENLIPQEKLPPYTEISTPASLTFDTLGDRNPEEASAFRDAIKKIKSDLDEFFNMAERKVRYGLESNANGQSVVSYFLDRIKLTTTALYAMDQADIKTSARFWVTWEHDDAYKKFREATWRSEAKIKQRIFVARDWRGFKDDWRAISFLAEELRHDVQIGLILDEDLKKIAASSWAATEKPIRHQLKADATIDSDFILSDLIHRNGTSYVEKNTQGFEVSYQKYKLPQVAYQNLLCEKRMIALAEWYRYVWHSDFTFKLISLDQGGDMDKFQNFLDKEVEVFDAADGVHKKANNEI